MTEEQPMHGFWNNFLMIFNLVSVMFCLYHMICFSDFVNPEGEYYMGFSFLITISVFLAVNIIFVLFDLMNILLLYGELYFGAVRRFVRPCEAFMKQNC